MSISETERVPLSFNQEFLCNFDTGGDDGPFGSAYNIVCGWRVSGPVDETIARAALKDLVTRHETLRTLIVNSGGERYQEIVPPAQPELSVLDLSTAEDRDLRSEQLLNDCEAGKHTARDLPLIRAVLGRFDATDAVLVFTAHHSAVDEWSLQLIMRDFAAFYTSRVTGEAPDLPEVAQYREFTEKELAGADSPAVLRAQEYWHRKLDGALMANTPTDHRRSAGLPKNTSWHRFLIDAAITAPIHTVARETRCSPFMVMLAAYKVLLHRQSGATDLTVPTFTSGRNDARFHATVGSFFNYVPLRTNLSTATTFREAVTAVRSTCLEAYKHDIPFGQIMAQAPQLMSSVMTDTDTVIAFQVVGSPFIADSTEGVLTYTGIRRRKLGQQEGGDVPDGALFQLGVDPSGDLVGTLGFNSNLFLEETLVGMVDQYRTILTTHVANPDSPL